jgi:hypothetical protein
MPVESYFLRRWMLRLFFLCRFAGVGSAGAFASRRPASSKVSGSLKSIALGMSLGAERQIRLRYEGRCDRQIPTGNVPA